MKKIVFYFLILLVMGCSEDKVQKASVTEPPTASSKTLTHNAKPQQKSSVSVSMMLEKIISIDEKLRFEVLNSPDPWIHSLSLELLDNSVSTVGPKNFSTLIFKLIKENSDILYRCNPTTLAIIELEEKSFPNIAYYYARVSPERGLPKLKNMAKKHQGNKLRFVIQAIAEIQNSSAQKFLMQLLSQHRSLNIPLQDIFVGFQKAAISLDKKQLLSLLNNPLNRDAIIQLSKVPIQLTHDDLMQFITLGRTHRFYASEVILGAPIQYAPLIEPVVQSFLNENNMDQAKMILHSDSIQNVNDTDFQVKIKALLDDIKE